MIIFGTKEVGRDDGGGRFVCPNCGPQEYRLKKVRRYVTLYFVPVFPMGGEKGEYVECRRCKTAWSTDVLRGTPPAPGAGAMRGAPPAGGADMRHRGVRLALLHMVMADGTPDAAEIEMARQSFRKVTGQDVDPAALMQEARSLAAERDAMLRELAALRPTLDDAGREAVVKAAFYVAAADGAFQEEERKLLGQIAGALDMTPAHLQGVIQSALRD